MIGRAVEPAAPGDPRDPRGGGAQSRERGRRDPPPQSATGRTSTMAWIRTGRTPSRSSSPATRTTCRAPTSSPSTPAPPRTRRTATTCCRRRVTPDHTPYFTWNPTPQAEGYFVLVSRDPNFTTVTDYACPGRRTPPVQQQRDELRRRDDGLLLGRAPVRLPRRHQRPGGPAAGEPLYVREGSRAAGGGQADGGATSVNLRPTFTWGLAMGADVHAPGRDRSAVLRPGRDRRDHLERTRRRTATRPTRACTGASGPTTGTTSH